MLLVAIIVDPTARVYSFEAPADRKEAVGSHSSNKFNAAPAASFNPVRQLIAGWYYTYVAYLLSQPAFTGYAWHLTGRGDVASGFWLRIRRAGPR